MVEYGNGLHGLAYLDIWSPAGGTVGGSCGTSVTWGLSGRSESPQRTQQVITGYGFAPSSLLLQDPHRMLHHCRESFPRQQTVSARMDPNSTESRTKTNLSSLELLLSRTQ